jgi:hypothetical protein
LVVAVEDESFDLKQILEVPTNSHLFFLASLTQQSFAAGNLGSRKGYGSAEASSTVTFDVSTEAQASIIFDLESTLGLPPPMLGVVSVPEPGSGWLQLVVPASLASLRRPRAI